MKQTTICAICACLLLAGCGGGGGSSGLSFVPHSTLRNISIDKLIPSASTFKDSKPQHKNGFVWQSTNVDSNNVTRDLFNISLSGPATNLNYVFSYDATGDGAAEFVVKTSNLPSTNVSLGYDHGVAHAAPPDSAVIFGGVPVDKDGNGVSDGHLYFTSSETYYNTAVSATVSSDADYHQSGWWAYTPANGNTADYDFGVFWGASQESHFKNIDMAVGAATYISRNYYGLAWPSSSSSNSRTGHFFGHSGLTLNANFETNKISGVLSNFNTVFGAVTTNYSGAINFAETDIMNLDSGASNFFSGASSGTLTDSNSNSYTASGNYGGMFYGGDGNNGDQPEGAGVTFSGTVEDANGNGFHYGGTADMLRQ